VRFSWDWGAIASLALATGWAIVLAWRLVAIWRTREATSPPPNARLLLACGGFLLVFACLYVLVGWLRGAATPYAWMSAHAWTLVPLFLANAAFFYPVQALQRGRA